MDLGEVQVGSEGDVKLGVEGGKLVLSLVHIHASGELTLVVKEDIKYFLEKLKAVIPGNWDDLVINLIEGSLP